MANGKVQSLAAYGKCLSFTRKYGKDPHDFIPPTPCELQSRKVETRDAASSSKDLTSHPAFHSCFLMLLAALRPKGKTCRSQNDCPKEGANLTARKTVARNKIAWELEGFHCPTVL